MKLTHVLLGAAAVYVGVYLYNQHASGATPSASGLVDSVKSDAGAAISVFVPKGSSIAPGPATAPASDPSASNGDATTRLMVSITRPFYPQNPYPTQLPSGKGPTPVVLTRADRIRAGAVY